VLSGAAAAVLGGVGVVVPGAEDGAAVARGRVTGPPPTDWFDAPRHLGRRGWKYHAPAVRYLVAATRIAVADGGLATADPLSGGVSIGTHDSVGVLHRRFDDALRTEGIRGLSPAELPGFSVNTAASHLAITHASHGFCLTLTNPLTAGIEALLHGARAVRAGTVARVLAGATEDTDPGATVHPGACVMLLTTAAGLPAQDDTPPAVVGGCTGFLSAPAGEPGPVARSAPYSAALVTLAGRIAGLVPAGMGAHGEPVGYAFCAPPSSRQLDRPVRDLLTERGTPVTQREYLGARGEFSTVSPLLQIVGLLTEFRSGLLVAASPLGPVAAVYVARMSKG